VFNFFPVLKKRKRLILEEVVSSKMDEFGLSKSKGKDEEMKPLFYLTQHKIDQEAMVSYQPVGDSS